MAGDLTSVRRQAWKRRQSKLAHYWMSSDHHSSDDVRVEFTGEFRYSVWLAGMASITPRRHIRVRYLQVRPGQVDSLVTSR